jgi:hypothetical protein
MLKSFKLLNVETAHRSKHLKEGYKHFIAGNKRLFRTSAEYKRQIKKEFLYFPTCWEFMKQVVIV